MMQRRGSGGGLAILFVAIGVLFLLAPLVLPIPVGSQVVLMGFGVVLLAISAVVLTITRLYHKTSADVALVRTGMGGLRPIIDGGALVVPVVHEIIPVSLQTMRLDVERSGVNALITGDNLRADVEAEFFIKVQKKQDDVLAAATSLGERSVDAESVKALVFQKLVSALRTVAATRSLGELHTKRDDFAQAVQQIVEKDLAHNGLTLESVTISKLDQTPPTSMRGEDNVFDAQGLRRIAEVTQQARIERNQIEREADKQVKARDVERDLFIYRQDISRSQAEATKDRDIQLAQAQARQESDTFAAEQARLAGIAQVERDQAIQIAEVEKNRALEVANQARERAAREAEIGKDRAVDIATREMEIAIATKERERAIAEAERFSAEAEKEAQRQTVFTVEVTQSAERDKSKTVIQAQADIERKRLTEQMEADVLAYGAVKEAEAEREAAGRRAEARLTLARADRQAKELEAEGDKAGQMVPVDVDRQRVDVERARVDVRREDLKNQAEFDTIARDLQVDLAKIEAEKEVRIEAARSFGTAMASAKMTVWGSPETVKEMSEAFFRGQQNGQFADGLIHSAPPEVRAVLGNLGQLGAAIVERLTGAKVDPQQVEQAIEEALAEPNGTRPVETKAE